MNSLPVSDRARDSLWAYRNLRDMDPALRGDLLREPPEEYTVPASAGIVAMVCRELGVDPTKGSEGDEVWRHLRGRPVSRLYECYSQALEAVRNDDTKEVYRLIRELGESCPDAFASSEAQGGSQ